MSGARRLVLELAVTPIEDYEGGERIQAAIVRFERDGDEVTVSKMLSLACVLTDGNRAPGDPYYQIADLVNTAVTSAITSTMAGDE